MSMDSYSFDLPEDCIAKALSLTTPKDACRLSAVAANYRSAAQSDAVWERFLPSDYQQIISRSVDEPDTLLRRFSSKKELYLYLCDNPILIDNGLKSFWLDKLGGKKCYMLAARDLAIVWGDTPHYWQWIPLDESRFAEVAELMDVCWFDIKGKINLSMLSPDTKYAAYLVYRPRYIIHGFAYRRVEASVSLSGQEGEKNVICLDSPDETPRRACAQDLPSDTNYPKQRDDGWIEVELGGFFVNGGEVGELEMSVTEVKYLNWKSGIVIQGIEIRPKPDVV